MDSESPAPDTDEAFRFKAFSPSALLHNLSFDWPRHLTQTSPIITSIKYTIWKQWLFNKKNSFLFSQSVYSKPPAEKPLVG